MKKLILACSMLVFAAANTQAQEKETARPEMSKEKKAELKKIKEEHLVSSFKDAGLTEDEIKRSQEVIENAMQKSNDLKADKTMTDEERKTKKDAINDEKNSKLKDIMGEKYKTWNEIRKKQKSEEEEFSKGS
jgi:hypothetical protein